MYKWFFIASFIYVTAFEKNSLTFDPDEMVLAECIKHHFVVFNNQYKETSVANDVSELAAKRFHGKSMSNEVFDTRFKQFIYQLRMGKIIHHISKDQLSEHLRIALKEALRVCGDLPSLLEITISEKETLEEVTNEDNEWIAFNPIKDLFSRCIEGYLELTGYNKFNLENGFTKVIADLAARRYYGKILSRKDFYERNKKFFHDLQSNKILHEMNIHKLSTEVKLLIQQAMENCTINNYPFTAMPTFKLEPIEIAQLLNLILVKWPDDLRHMIQSKNGRRVLRKYAIDSRTALIRELNNCHNNTQVFRNRLRLFWKIRAREMYDANSVEPPYIEHRYNLNYPSPHMIQFNSDDFHNRKSTSFNHRNPLVPRFYLNRILDIHRADNSNNENKFDIFDSYNKNGMTSAEYYFENQLNQFYRILFLFLELRARGIRNDKNDTYNGPLPYNLVPEQIQAIIDDDDVYRDYLLDERFFYHMLLGNNTRDEIAQNLFRSTRVLEENLILLRSYYPSTSGTQSGSQIATTVKTVITTSQSLKRKDEVWKNKNGKCFSCKKVKTSTNSDDDLNSNLENWNPVTNPSLRENDYSDNLFTMCSGSHALEEQDKIETNSLYGYIIHRDDDDFSELQFTYEELSFLQSLPS